MSDTAALLEAIFLYVQAERGGHPATIEAIKERAGEFLDRYIDQRVQQALEARRGEW